MNNLKILIYPDSRLKLKALPVTKFDQQLADLADDMLELMYRKNGAGLASIQVNIQKQIFVMDVSDTRDQPYVFVNPKIIRTEGEQVSPEGCLSFPGIVLEIDRPQLVEVEAYDVKGEKFTLVAEGFKAKCIHHEMEHLDGNYFLKHLSRLKQQRAIKKLEKLKRLVKHQEE